MEKSELIKENKKQNDEILATNPDAAVINNVGHHLFVLAIKKAREERQQAKLRQKNPKYPTIQQRQTILVKKKNLTIADIDRLFEEKRLRPLAMKNDLMDLYKKSPSRIRSMLDIQQIDQFIQTTEYRKNCFNIKSTF